ncbi:MAG: hypothetical protein FWC83_00215 [Alphaproteobacteria bacterium]|nr:hypothetical protein [Alphaproteobacteria bacterium]
MKVGIIGSGGWGSALAVAIKRAGHDCVLWSHSGTLGAEARKQCNIDEITNTPITTNFSDLTDADVWLMVTPSEFYYETMQKSRPFWNNQPIIICAKGIGPRGGLKSAGLSEIFGSDVNVGMFSGPQYAAEVSDGKLTGSTVAGDDNIIRIGREIFREFVLEETDDIIGTQLGGAGANVAAVLMGYLTENGAAENERALRITQIWDEIRAIGRAIGARDETFAGLSGLGELILKSNSKTSRNYASGRDVAAGRAIIGTVEGVVATKGFLELAKKAGVSCPNIEYLDEKIRGL